MSPSTGKGVQASMPKPPVMKVRPVISSSEVVRWAIRPSAVLALAIIVVLSVVPGDFRPSTGASGNFEHFIAYAGTAGLLALSRVVRSSWSIVLLVAGLAGLAGSLELAQIWIPGRSAGWDNFFASSAGGLVGTMVARLVGGPWGFWARLDEQGRNRP